MDPKVWGPHFWFVLHLIAFHYPEKPNSFDKDAYKNYYHSVKDILPCTMCKQHFKNYLSQYPIEPHLDSKLDLIRWVNQIHNFVNVKLGKPALSHDDIFMIYSNLDPVSPFIKVDIEKINNKKELKRNGRIYAIVIMCALIIVGLKVFQSKYYYYLI